MKKLIAAIAAAFVMTLGLVALSEGPASAACPYSACINTSLSVTAHQSIRARHSAPINVRIAAPGNITPTGNVTVTVSRFGHVVYVSTQLYVGGNLTFVTGPLRKGVYAVTAVFNPAPGSVFNGSSGATSFHVKKKHHRHHHHH